MPYYDLQGNEIDVEEFLRLIEDLDYKRVAYDCIGSVRVSTVWLGLNHRFIGDGPAFLFETMIFGGDRNGELYRYETKEEAQKNHADIMKELREGF